MFGLGFYVLLFSFMDFNFLYFVEMVNSKSTKNNFLADMYGARKVMKRTK